MENKPIDIAIQFSQLIRTTLGPRGMNKCVVKGANTLITNDGATILKNVVGGNPIIDMIRQVAISQEEIIGDGTTTSVILAGQLLENAKNLTNKGLHPTTIINGYNLANVECMKQLQGMSEEVDKKLICHTAFGSKLPKEQVEHFTNLLLQIDDFNNLTFVKIPHDNAIDSEIYPGFVFQAMTINDRVKKERSGNVAVMDFRTNITEDVKITSADEVLRAKTVRADYFKSIADKLKSLDVQTVFYTDTCPDLEAYLTENDLTGVVIFRREELDNIANTTGAIVSADINLENKLGKADIKFDKKGLCYIKGARQSFILKGSTRQVLDEIDRSIHDVISLLKNDTAAVVGAGAVEIELANNLYNFAKKVGGKEQLAIKAFAEALESIPLIIAENCGLDALEILTNLKTMHEQGEKDMGVDIIVGISDARKRDIFEPVLVKIHAISAANNVTNLILKTDDFLQGDLDDKA